jgi:hypothetical protein
VIKEEKGLAAPGTTIGGDTAKPEAERGKGGQNAEEAQARGVEQPAVRVLDHPGNVLGNVGRQPSAPALPLSCQPNPPNDYYLIYL